jgi:hypothetical protein
MQLLLRRHRKYRVDHSFAFVPGDTSDYAKKIGSIMTGNAPLQLRIIFVEHEGSIIVSTQGIANHHLHTTTYTRGIGASSMYFKNASRAAGHLAPHGPK